MSEREEARARAGVLMPPARRPSPPAPPRPASRGRRGWRPPSARRG